MTHLLFDPVFTQALNLLYLLHGVSYSRFRAKHTLGERIELPPAPEHLDARVSRKE